MARLPIDFTDSSGNFSEQLVSQAEQNANANFLELYSGTGLATSSTTFATVQAGNLFQNVGGTTRIGAFGTVGTSTTNIGKLAIEDQYGTVRYVACLLP